MHILDPSELNKAASLVNSNGGEWGYVTVPIRATDRDYKKWQKFMDDARNFKLIPLIRLAGVPRGETWSKPTVDEIIDFSNFLNDLEWPTRIKHVIIFNEPNHSREWGGEVNPVEYAGILNFSIDRFKSLDENFWVLPAAMDAAVPNSATSMAEYKYLTRMLSSFPELASKIDGINSHSYPNPAFSGRPSDRHIRSINSYAHELAFYSKYTSKRLPVFITETGWQMSTNSEDTVAEYYKRAFNTTWDDPRIVAVTPFLLEARGGDFQKFSLVKTDGTLSKPAQIIKTLPKESGSPELAYTGDNKALEQVYATGAEPDTSAKNFSISFVNQKIKLFWTEFLKLYYKLIKKDVVEINGETIQVEIADTDRLRTQGLSGRESMSEDRGMLFTFPNPGTYGFWMKDMKFPLDFLWIMDNKIVQINENIPPPKEGERPQTVVPESPIDKVLEVNAGFAGRHYIKVGDIVNLN